MRGSPHSPTSLHTHDQTPTSSCHHSQEKSPAPFRNCLIFPEFLAFRVSTHANPSHHYPYPTCPTYTHHLPCDPGRIERRELALLGPLTAWERWHWATPPLGVKLFVPLSRENQVTQGREQEHTHQAPGLRGSPCGVPRQARHGGRRNCPSPVSSVWLSSSHGLCTSLPGAREDGCEGARADADCDADSSTASYMQERRALRA